jgi:hypothetical protein
MERLERIFNRGDGSSVKLVLIANANVFTGRDEVDVFAVASKDGEDDKYYYPNNGCYNKSLRGLSVEEYIERGRQGLMAAVRPNELIKATNDITQLFVNRAK